MEASLNKSTFWDIPHCVGQCLRLPLREVCSRQGGRYQQRGEVGDHRSGQLHSEERPASLRAMFIYFDCHSIIQELNHGCRHMNKKLLHGRDSHYGSHLHNVLLDPIIIPIHAVPPDVGLFRNEFAVLQGRFSLLLNGHRSFGKKKCKHLQ